MELQVILDAIYAIQQASLDVLGFNILLMLPVFLFTEIISKLTHLKEKFPKRHTPFTAILAFLVAVPISLTAFPLAPLATFVGNTLILSSVGAFSYVVVKPFAISTIKFLRKKFKERTGVDVE